MTTANTTAAACTCVHCPVHSLPEDAIKVTTLAETPTTLTLTATAIGRCGHQVTYTNTERFKEPFTALGRFRAEDSHRRRTPKRHCSPACRRKSELVREAELITKGATPMDVFVI